MDKEFHFNEKLIFNIDTKDKTKEAVLEFLAQKLEDEGCVKAEYKHAVLKREENYPTGLQTSQINIAIPHTEYIYVKSDAMAIGILSEAIAFQAMDNPQQSIPVRIIMMLALSQPHGQLEMLGKIVGLFEMQDELNRILNNKNTGEVYEIITKKLL